MTIRPHIKVMTPCFAAQVTSAYTTSLLSLWYACRKRGVGISWSLHGADALITRARAECVASFLQQPEPTHLLFIDADIAFEPEQVFRLLDFDADMTAAAYPVKSIKWDRIGTAFRAGYPDPEAVAQHYVPGLEGSAEIVTRNEFVRVRHAGTGFLMIRRSALLRMCSAYAALRYRSLGGQKHPLDGSPYRIALFEPLIVPETGTYLGEDYAFCRRWEELGGEIWLDIRSKLTHIGPTPFKGDLFQHFTRMPALSRSKAEESAPPSTISRQSDQTASAHHIKVVTPSHGGQVSANYAASMLDLALACFRRDIRLSWDLGSVESDIACARDAFVRRFLEEPDATHLLFIDADIGFAPDQAMRLLNFDAEFTAAAYPLTKFDWSRIVSATRKGNTSPASVLDYAVAWGESEEASSQDDFRRVRSVGLGFVMLRRSALLKLSAAYVDRIRDIADAEANQPKKSSVGPGLFGHMVEPETGIYLSECFAFCRRWTNLGGKIWLDTRSKLTHVGPLAYRGDLLSLVGPVPDSEGSDHV